MGWPGSLSHDFEIWPITFQGSGPSGPILFICEKSHFNKNIHITVSLRTPQNRNRASDFFQDWWAEVTHGSKNGGSFSEMMGPSISN